MDGPDGGRNMQKARTSAIARARVAAGSATQPTIQAVSAAPAIARVTAGVEECIELDRGAQDAVSKPR